jgi:hypothetical protein
MFLNIDSLTLKNTKHLGISTCNIRATYFFAGVLVCSRAKLGKICVLRGKKLSVSSPAPI